MNLNEFVNKVFLRFPPDIKNNDKEAAVMLDYIKALDTGKEYDYDNAFTDLMRSYSFKTLPTAKILLETLKQNETKEFNNKKSTEWKPLKSLWAFKNQRLYEFAIPLNSNEPEACKWLISQGFGSLTNQNPFMTK